MSQLIQQLIDNFVVLVAALIVLGLGWFSINYLSKRRQMLHQERMATLVKSLHYAGVAKDIFNKPKAADSRNHALRGLGWLLGAAGFSAALYGYTSMQPFGDPTIPVRSALAGIVPGSIGLAHLVFSAMSRNRQKPNFSSAMLRHRQRPNFPTRPLYR